MAGADRIGVGWSPSPQTYHHGCLHGLRLFVHLIHDGFCGCAAFGVAFIIALIVVGLARVLLIDGVMEAALPF